MSSLKTNVVDGFEKESFVLLEYVNALHSKLLQQEEDFKRIEAQLLNEQKAIEQEMGSALQYAKLQKSRLQRENDKFVNESNTAVHTLEDHLDSSSLSLRRERQKAQELENTVVDLKQQLERHKQLHDRRKARNEKEKASLNDELNELQTKVNLGWILGNLQDAYLRSDKAGDEDWQRRTQFNDKMSGLKRQIQWLIESEVQTPKDVLRPDEQNGRDFDSDSEIEFGRDEELDGMARKYAGKKSKDFCEGRRGRSMPPRLAQGV